MRTISYFKHSLIMLLAFITGIVMFSSCNEDEFADEGAPSIKMVRTTDEPDASLESGGLGETVIIEGNNFSTTQMITINDFEVDFLPTFVTRTHIVLQIPEETPTLATQESVNNEIKIITSKGSATHSFTVLPPPPQIEFVSNEFAKAGETLVIKGKFFFFVEEVLFPGDISSTDITATNDGSSLTVTVPEGITDAGSIVVVTESGSVDSAPKYRFNDYTGIVCNYDDVNPFGAWGAKPVLADPGSDPTPEPIDEAYLRIESEGEIVPESWWNNDWVMPTSGVPSPSVSGPASDYALKFEMNVPEVWNSGWFEMNFGWWTFYRFKPWEVNPDPQLYWEVHGERTNFTTDGWQTVVIPINKFRTKPDGAPSGDPVASVEDILGNDIVWAFQNPNADEPNNGVTIDKLHVCFDNLRIVKIK